jgi:hypothetical protein
LFATPFPTPSARRLAGAGRGRHPIFIAVAAVQHHRHWFVSALAIYMLAKLGIVLAKLADRARWTL